jgi:hypothetical protein
VCTQTVKYFVIKAHLHQVRSSNVHCQLNAKLSVAGDIYISRNNFMAVVEMGVRFLHHVLKFIFPDIAEECTASICHHPNPDITLLSCVTG